MITIAPEPTARAVPLSAGLIADVTGGRLERGDPATAVAAVSIDSRTLRRGDLFVAIEGERFDGHFFAPAACAAGAIGVVVRTAPLNVPDHVFVIRVAETTRALQELAAYVRRASGTTVVAVTGSAGKTTTKELAATLLASRGEVFRSQGNFNNHIGLPLSLLNLSRGYPTAVVELGMNHAGELRVLTAIARPDVRVWTNVAAVHTEFFPSIDAIADAKAEILEGATADTVVVANAGDPRVMTRVRACPARVITFGIGVDADVAAIEVTDRGVDGTRADVRTPAGVITLDVPLIGRGHLANALAATAVALAFGIPLPEIASRLAAARPAARRGTVHRLAGDLTLIDDSYNANPDAVTRMLEALAATPVTGRRMAVLGEMRELGESSEAWHRHCGRAAAAAGLGGLMAVGGPAARALAAEALAAGMPADTVTCADTSDAAAVRMADWLRSGDVVLVKGSRGTRTDVVVDRVLASRARTAVVGEGA